MEHEQENSARLGERIGLCASCRHRVDQPTKRGAVFFRCAWADVDGRFQRYPPLPVLACDGHRPRDHDSDEAPGRE